MKWHPMWDTLNQGVSHFIFPLSGTFNWDVGLAAEVDKRLKDTRSFVEMEIRSKSKLTNGRWDFYFLPGKVLCVVQYENDPKIDALAVATMIEFVTRHPEQRMALFYPNLAQYVTPIPPNLILFGE